MLAAFVNLTQARLTWKSQVGNAYLGLTCWQVCRGRGSIFLVNDQHKRAKPTVGGASPG